MHILYDRGNAGREAVKIPPNYVPALAIVAVFGPEYLLAQKGRRVESNGFRQPGGGGGRED